MSIKNKQLNEIRKKSFKVGNILHKKFKKTGGTKAAEASMLAYNVTLRAIKYQILYKNK